MDEGIGDTFVSVGVEDGAHTSVPISASDSARIPRAAHLELLPDEVGLVSFRLRLVEPQLAGSNYAVDALTQRHHFTRGSFRNGRTSICRRTGVGMGTLRRIRGGFNDVAGRSRRARTRSRIRGTVRRAAAINNSVDSSALVVGNVERAVCSNGKAARAMCSFVRRFDCARETVRKYFATTRSVAVRHRLENNVIALLLLRCPVP